MKTETTRCRSCFDKFVLNPNKKYAEYCSDKCANDRYHRVRTYSQIMDKSPENIKSKAVPLTEESARAVMVQKILDKYGDS